MMENLKRILIVDDSEIDREILKSIFADEFEVIEVDNGYSALEMILKKKEHLDALLLDVSMPLLDGLSVLRILRENNFNSVPVFMITAEATKDNIEKASQLRISEFIRKPFDRDEILKRVRLKLGVMERHRFTDEDISETKRYISDLNSIYDRYLAFSGEDKDHMERRADLMKIFLEKYPVIAKGTEFDGFRIEMISKAAYFCDIGNMLIQNMQTESDAGNRRKSGVNQKHTVMGAAFIHLNYGEHCRYFVQICAEMCLHHHERYDGQGFPHGISGSKIPLYTQLCGLLDRFDNLYFRIRENHEQPFELVLDELERDIGFVDKEVLSMLVQSKSDILNYYSENYI